jgi:hypothetical protein
LAACAIASTGRFLIAAVKGVALGIRLGDVVGQQAFLRDFQVFVLLRHGGLQGGYLCGGFGFHFRVGFGTCQDVAHVEEMCAVVHALQADG